MYKMIAFYRKPDDTEAFLTRFKEGHVKTIAALPGIVSWTLNIVDKSLIGTCAYWAYAEMCFHTEAEMKSALRSPEMMACGADAQEFAAEIITVTLGHEVG